MQPLDNSGSRDNSGKSRNSGILLGGRSARKHERTLYVYLGLIGKDIFIQNYFNRSFILLDTMSEVRKQMSTKTADPNTIDIVRARLAEASKSGTRYRLSACSAAVTSTASTCE